MDKQKVFRRVNLLANLLLGLSCVVFLIVFAATGYRKDRVPACIGVALVALLPFVLEKIFRMKFSNFLLAAFNICYILSGIVGSIWGGWSTIPLYDKIIHTVVVGYAGSMVGLLLLSLLGDLGGMKRATVILFCFFCASTIGALWEVYEYCADLWLGQVAQGAPVELTNGSLGTLVDDTMQDIVANSLGALLFALHYILHRVTGKNLLMGSMLKDFESMKRENKNVSLEKPEKEPEEEKNIEKE